MAVTKAKFVSIAQKIFTKFADFKVSTSIETNTRFNYQSQTSKNDNDTIDTIQLNYQDYLKSMNMQGTSTSEHVITDVLICLYSQLSNVTSVVQSGDTVLTRSGLKYKVVKFEIDPAFATIMFYVEAL